jgi:hypothetical protein
MDVCAAFFLKGSNLLPERFVPFDEKVRTSGKTGC